MGVSRHAIQVNQMATSTALALQRIQASPAGQPVATSSTYETQTFASLADEDVYSQQSFHGAGHNDPYIPPQQIETPTQDPVYRPPSTAISSHWSALGSHHGLAGQPRPVAAAPGFMSPQSVLSASSLTQSSQYAAYQRSHIPSGADIENGAPGFIPESQRSGTPSSSSGSIPEQISDLPEYYQNVLVSQAKQSTVSKQPDTPIAKHLETNPVSNVVADRSSLLSVVFPFLAANIAVFLYMNFSVFWPNLRGGFPVEILILVPITLKIFLVLFTPQRPSDQVLVDGQNVAVFVPVFGETVAQLTKTLGAIHAQTYKSIALVVVVDHHVDGLKNVLTLLEADIDDGAVNPITGDLEYNGIYDNDLPYTVIMKRHHSGKHGSECVFLRHLYKHCENFKYFVTVDGDTAIHPDAISNLITEMEIDPSVIASFGRVLIANDRSGVWAITHAVLDAFEYSINKHFQSLTAVNFVTHMPGNFSCFRTDRIFSSNYDYWGLSLDSKTSHSYLWKPNLAYGKNMLLQEDRRRTLLLLVNKHKHEHIRYIKSAVAETTVVTSLKDFVAKFRRRYVSTIANTVFFLASTRAWRSPAGAFAELHSLVAELSLPFICIYLYSAVVRMFGNFANEGALMGLWMILLAAVLLFVNGHAKYTLLMFVLIFTAPVFMVYVPIYAILTFTTMPWATRSEDTGGNPKAKFHLILTYVATAVCVIVLTWVFFCDDVNAKCYF
eukprot:c32304_g1_i1.p1 GENE.c32304_g1_i1~~c32304_g1_i1.p1  ORF type:complete len:723 (+),score=120.64 c32304_g1_i1:1-2169(+)